MSHSAANGLPLLPNAGQFAGYVSLAQGELFGNFHHRVAHQPLPGNVSQRRVILGVHQAL